MTWYVVVTRDTSRTVISRHPSPEDAANRIVRALNYDTWSVMAQDGRGTTVVRALTNPERRRVERTLYPGLYECYE